MAAVGDINITDIRFNNDSRNPEAAENSAPKEVKTRVPRRVLHFSDGVIEEYSTDEEDNGKKANKEEVVKKTENKMLTADPKNVYWSSWFWFHVITFGSTTLSVCDYLGEKFAAFFGITTPKYEYEIDFYNTMKAEEEEQSKQQDLEMGGWTNSLKKAAENGTNGSSDVITTKEKERY